MTSTAILHLAKSYSLQNLGYLNLDFKILREVNIGLAEVQPTAFMCNTSSEDTLFTFLHSETAIQIREGSANTVRDHSEP